MPERLPLVPDGTTIPPTPYLVVTLLAAGLVAVALRRRSPAVTGGHVLGLAPWMVLGSALHVLYVIDALPASVAPFAGSPTVYVTVAIIAGATWGAADAVDATRDRTPAVLAASGGALLVPVVAVALRGGVSTTGLWWSGIAVLTTIPVVVLLWWVLRSAVPEVGATGGVGVLVVLGHALDGISTAVGVTQLGFGERTPLSRLILELGGLPSVPLLGEGWLFVLVKLAVAGLVVWLFIPYVREKPGEGYLLLGFIAAVGLGPAAHNLLLFSVGG
ncbi:DUF63 family protein [Halorubrum vacuolatum]|uniref:Uncharacterized membrane protein n=1 Tax=Halorubrum vacuolatum TaxID=63740 RepID=A0A238UPU7_HALVU|nr:DUF63 family protein [Halorubrum vacuolatum]SNR23309.1 Uncharacterized membrane protein [Halorubrum vacuolatum]